MQSPISAVLTNLDWTIERARKGIKELRKADAEEARNAELALTDLLARLEPVRKRFFQDSYFPADTSRLLCACAVVRAGAWTSERNAFRVSASVE
jgi:hypothetical protein